MKFKSRFLVVLEVAFAAMLLSCSSGPTRVDQDEDLSGPEQAVGAAEAQTYTAEVTFSRGSARLQPDSKKKLDALVQQARNSGKVDDVKIIGWADQAYPANAKKNLPVSQQSLADQRIDQVKNYLRKHDSFNDLDAFNMAKQPSRLSQLLNTENARVKHSLTKAGVSQTGIADTGASHKVGKAIVLVIMKAVSRQ